MTPLTDEQLIETYAVAKRELKRNIVWLGINVAAYAFFFHWINYFAVLVLCVLCGFSTDMLTTIRYIQKYRFMEQQKAREEG